MINTKGEAIGTHNGALTYTLGQRHGFTLETRDTKRTPMFVVQRNIEANTITVDTNVHTLGEKNNLTLHSRELRAATERGDDLEVQFRYRQQPLTAKVQEYSSSILVLTLPPETEQPASGQSCVLYRGTHCIGGGIVT